MHRLDRRDGSLEDTMNDDITSIYQLLDAIEAVIKAADPAKREALTRTIDAYAEDFPEDFFWATGSQAPMLLHHLLNTIDSACRVGTITDAVGAIGFAPCDGDQDIFPCP